MAFRQLLPVIVPAGPDVLDLMPSLSRALSGAGPALRLLPHDVPVDPVAGVPAGSGDDTLVGSEDEETDPTVVALSTSGSTGRPKQVLLPASALLASASATHDRLGGPGRWLLALPAYHVAGVQVLIRSLVSRTRPVVLDLTHGFDPAAFADAVDGLRGPRRYTALVPTQLIRLLDAGGRAVAALGRLDAVLVGGAALARTPLRRAEQEGIRVVASYGMTETCGGCVYDGVPLDGVEIRVDDAGRVSLGGPVVARGYRGDPGGEDSPFHTDERDRRWFRSNDAGTWDGGRLTVHGRLDDLIITGGLKVAPRAVESALLALPDLAQAVVVGVPDAQWGERVVAALVLSPGAGTPRLDRIRDHVASRLGRHAAPRQLVVLDALPALGPGKPDRARIAALAAGPE